MIKCKKCGRLNQDYTSLCPNCSSPMELTQAEVEELFSELDDRLERPEYYMQLEVVDGKHTLVQGTEKNPNYIDRPLRDVYNFFKRIIPHGQAIDYLRMVYPWLEPINVTLHLTEEEASLLNTLPFYSIGTICASFALGYIGFRKKELK